MGECIFERTGEFCTCCGRGAAKGRPAGLDEVGNVDLAALDEVNSRSRQKRVAVLDGAAAGRLAAMAGYPGAAVQVITDDPQLPPVIDVAALKRQEEARAYPRRRTRQNRKHRDRKPRARMAAASRKGNRK